MKKSFLAVSALGLMITANAAVHHKKPVIVPSAVTINTIVALELNGNPYLSKNKICYRYLKKYIGRRYVPHYQSLHSQTMQLYNQKGDHTTLSNRSFAGYYSFSTFRKFDGANRTYYIVHNKQAIVKLYFNIHNYQCLATNGDLG